MAEKWFKKKGDAEKFRDEILATYTHAVVESSHASFVVFYCCPKNPALAGLHAKLGARCIVAKGEN